MLNVHLQFSVGVPVIFVLKVYWGSISHDMVKLCLSEFFFKCSSSNKTFHSYLKMFDLKDNKNKKSNSNYHFYLQDVSRVECFVRVVNFALSFTLCTWRAVFSPTLLCAGLLQCVTIVSASHSSRFNLVFQFHSLMVNIRYCAISVPSVCIWCTVMHYCAVMHWRSVDRLLFYVKWVCVCACGYRMDLVGHGTHPASPLEIALEGEACTE